MVLLVFHYTAIIHYEHPSPLMLVIHHDRHNLISTKMYMYDVRDCELILVLMNTGCLSKDNI